MYSLYLALKDRKEPATGDKMAIASGTKELDAETASVYLGQVEAGSENLLSMFMKQSRENAVGQICSLITVLV